MTKTQKFTSVCLTAFLAAASASAEVLVYDGFPVGDGGYDAGVDQDPTAKGAITHADVIGFKSGEEWANNGTSVIYTHGSANGLELPAFASSVTKGASVGTSIGCHNAATSNMSYERAKFRPLKDDATFAAEAVGEDGKLHVRMLLRADETALTNLRKDATDENPITANNWYGAGFVYAASAPANGSHSLLRTGGRALWFGLVKDKNGAFQVILNVRGWDTAQQSEIVTLCEAIPNETYLCYAEITVNAAGADQVRAFAMPTGDWSVGNAQAKLADAQVVEAHLLDTGKPLNYLVAGGAYCTNNGRFAADEIGVATDAQDLIDLTETDSVFFSTVEMTGTPAEGIMARAALGNPPDSFSMKCYVGQSADKLQVVKEWLDQTPDTTSWEWPVENPQWGETYYAQFVMTAGDEELASRVVSCSPSATITWTGSAGDNVWESAGNWNPALVPTAILDAVFATATADLTHAQNDSIRGLRIEGGSKVAVAQAEGASLAADSLTVNSGFGNTLTIAGGSLSVQNDTILGTGRSSDKDRHDPVRGSNGDVIEFKNGDFTFNKIKLLGNTYDDANRFVVSNATLRANEIETVYDQNLSQGKVWFEAVDSVLANASHFQLHGIDTKATLKNCEVSNGGVLRLGQGANGPNEMRLFGTTWTQTGREVILGRKGLQYLEIGTGSSFTINDGTETASGNMIVGHGSDGGGTGTLVISNATLTIAKNLYMPQDQRYGSQYVRLYETDGGTAVVNCHNLYVGTTGYNGSSNKRTGDQASHFAMNGGTINCSRYLNVGAIHETCSNRLSIAGTTARCKAGLFNLVNASILDIQIPAGGFAAPALIEVTANAADAQGVATISADSSIEIDTTAYAGGTVTLLKAVKIDSALSAEEIAAKIVSRRSQTCKVWYEENEKGEKVALKLKVVKGGLCLVIR